MRRYWPILAAVLAAAGLWAVLGGSTHEDLGGDSAEHEATSGSGEVPLRGIPRDPHATRRDPTPEAPPPEDTERPDPRKEVEFLTGFVLDEVSGAPLPGASVWLQRQDVPCPRLPDPNAEWWLPGRGANGPIPTYPFPKGVTDGSGRFRLKAFEDQVPRTGSIDVFASAAGHVLGVACAAAVPGEVTIRLATALRMKVEVVDPNGRPVPDAVVRARPGPSTPATPGHGAAAVTGERGVAELDGLLPGAVSIEVDHPAFMPAASGPYDPRNDAFVTTQLTPALRTTFTVRSDDGRPLKNVTLHWKTDGQPPLEELRLLRCLPLETKAEPGAELGCASVRIPCSRRTVVFQVKADGYAAWTSPEETLPPEGGEKAYEVTLAGDAGLGSIRVLLEDESGQKIRYDESKSSVLAVVRTDGPPPASGYVLEGGEDLRFPSMPQGVYVVHLRSPVFAPAEADATVVAGREVEVRVRTRPPARLRVRFVAPEPIVVRFRLMQSGRIVVAVPVDVPTTTEGDAGQPVYSAGAEGMLLSGLARGTYSVEVLNPDWTAPPTTVGLREGDTEEVEIDVKRR